MLDKQTVLLVDDEPFLRSSVKEYLELKGFIVTEAQDVPSAKAALAAAVVDDSGQSPFAACILDLGLLDLDAREKGPQARLGLDLAAYVKKNWPAMGLVLFSAYHNHKEAFQEMMEMGAGGMVYKVKAGCKPEDLVEAVYSAIAGGISIDPIVMKHRSLADEVLDLMSPDERFWVEPALDNLYLLNESEWKVARIASLSCTYEGIAYMLGLSEQTVANYARSLYAKLGLNGIQHSSQHLRQSVVLAKVMMIASLRRSEHNADN